MWLYQNICGACLKTIKNFYFTVNVSLVLYGTLILKLTNTTLNLVQLLIEQYTLPGTERVKKKLKFTDTTNGEIKNCPSKYQNSVQHDLLCLYSVFNQSKRKISLFWNP